MTLKERRLGTPQCSPISRASVSGCPDKPHSAPPPGYNARAPRPFLAHASVTSPLPPPTTIPHLRTQPQFSPDSHLANMVFFFKLLASLLDVTKKLKRRKRRKVRVIPNVDISTQSGGVTNNDGVDVYPDGDNQSSSQTSLKDLIAIAEMEIQLEKNHSEEILDKAEEDSCYNSCEEDDDMYEEMNAFDEVEDLYEEMHFEKSVTLGHNSLYMSMVFHRD